MRKSEVLAAESVACLNKALSRLKDIWEEIGIPEDQRLQRTSVVKTHIKGLLDMMIAEEESLKERLLKSISICRKELDSLCKELHLSPFEEEEGNTILQLEKDLRMRVEVMLKQKKERMQEMKALQEQDQDLCDILCSDLYIIDTDSVPSLDELEKFRLHIKALNAEKEKRKAEFAKVKHNIVLYMEELDLTPDTSFERDVVCEEEEAFCLSEDNIAALHQLLQQLEHQRAESEAYCSTLRRQISTLWDRLQVPQEEREAFAVHMKGARAKTRKALQEEVSRLEELKLQNIRNVVNGIRKELSSYWDKCFFSNAQRQMFTPYYNDNCTEEILQLHENEVYKMKQYYERHRELFEGIQKWEENWKHFMELERKATDPTRFTNRGGNLLKEEKQRAKLQKTLPKLEEELKLRINAWEHEQKQEFLVNGRKFLDHVSEQLELHHVEKEREKLERQLKKNKLIEEEMLYGSVPKTPTKRRVPVANTPSKVRKLNATSISSTTSNSTMRSAFSGMVCHSPVSRPLPSGGKHAQSVRTPSRSVVKHPRIRLEHNKENMLHLTGSILTGGCISTATSHSNFSINSVASTYSQFTRELSKATKPDGACQILNSTTARVQR